MYLYPKIAKPVYEHSLNSQAEIRRLKQKASDETLISIEEKRELLNQFETREGELENRLFSSQRQIKVLREENDELKNSNAELSSVVSSLRENESQQVELQSKYNAEVKRTEQLKATLKNEMLLGEERLTDKEIGKVLTNSNFVLHHNPAMGGDRSKVISFGSDGLVHEGRNDNENKWRVVSGHLELVQSDGIVHSRFYYAPLHRLFFSTNEKDNPAAPGQFIVTTSAA